MISRVILTSLTSLSLERRIRKVTAVPGLPRKSLTASGKVNLSVEVPSTAMILSPGISPAFQPGVSSIGAMMVMILSFIPIWMPMPPNWPSVSERISSNDSGSMNWLCGSSELSIPFRAL